MEKQALSDYIQLIRQYYPCSAGLSKERLLAVMADPRDPAWEKIRTVSELKISRQAEWKEFIHCLRAGLADCVVEDKTNDNPLAHPVWSAHITLAGEPSQGRMMDRLPGVRKIIFNRTAIGNLAGLVFIDYAILNIDEPIAELKYRNPLIFKNRYSFFPQDEKFKPFAIRIQELAAASFSCDFLPPEFCRHTVDNIVYVYNSSSFDPTSSILYFLFFGEQIW